MASYQTNDYFEILDLGFRSLRFMSICMVTGHVSLHDWPCIMSHDVLQSSHYVSAALFLSAARRLTI